MVKLTLKKEVEYDAAYLLVDVGVRYWEDGSVNGVDDTEDDPQMPFAVGNVWRIRIDLENGQISNWPQGVAASTHYKVCDDGVYTLLAEDMSPIIKKDGYVPPMLAPKGKGYGDYIIMDIDAAGKIDGFRADLSYFERDE